MKMTKAQKQRATLAGAVLVVLIVGGVAVWSAQQTDPAAATATVTPPPEGDDETPSQRADRLLENEYNRGYAAGKSLLAGSGKATMETAIAEASRATSETLRRQAVVHTDTLAEAPDLTKDFHMVWSDTPRTGQSAYYMGMAEALSDGLDRTVTVESTTANLRDYEVRLMAAY